MDIMETGRGFRFGTFLDANGEVCSIQKSSIATENCIWFGTQSANPQILSNGRWQPFPIPDDVLMTTRMHLSQEQVRRLLPVLQHFAETGDLPPVTED